MTTATSVHDTAAELAAKNNTFWTGPSGETVTGEATAHHLDTTRKLLERDGWVRNYGNDDQDVEMPDENASVKDMIRHLFRVIRDAVGTDKRCTLSSGIYAVTRSDDGDDDTEQTATRVLDVILRARSGANSAFYASWASKLGRTWEEVSDLLTEAAEFARTYGPA